MRYLLALVADLMAIVLYSRCCTEGVRHQGGDLPRTCPRCEKPCREWSVGTINEPRVPYVLTDDDVRYLKTQRIRVDDTDPRVLA